MLKIPYYEFSCALHTISMGFLVTLNTHSLDLFVAQNFKRKPFSVYEHTKTYWEKNHVTVNLRAKNDSFVKTTLNHQVINFKNSSLFIKFCTKYKRDLHFFLERP